MGLFGGCNNNGDSWIWIAVIVVFILLCDGNGFGSGNGCCNPCCDNNQCC